MPQYLVLIYEDETPFDDPAVEAEVHAQHVKFAQNVGAAIVGGNALESRATATTIRTDGSGAAVVTDGPFVETKDVLGGYYLIEAADLDAAIAIAKQCPAAYGGVEVRPVRELS